MTRTRPLRRAVLLSGPALLVVALLAGCDPALPGSAAIVGGQRIPVGLVQDRALEFLAIVPGAVGEGDVQLLVLEREIFSRVLDRAAKDADVDVTQSEIDQDRASVYAVTGGRTGLVRQLASGQQPEVLAPSQVEEFLRDRILFQKLATKVSAGGDPSSQQAQQAVSDALTKAGDELGIRVNPRYGTWNTQRGVVAEVSGGLSRSVDDLAAASASPSPAPSAP